MNTKTKRGPKTTYEDVASAMMALRKEGYENPSINRLSKHVELMTGKTGSTATISKFKSQFIQNEVAQSLPKDIESPGDPISQKAFELWNEMLDAVKGREMAMEAAINQRRHEVEDMLFENEKMIKTLKGEARVKDDEIDELNADIKHLSMEKSALEERVKGKDVEIVLQKNNVAVVNKQLLELQAELADEKASRQAKEKELNEIISTLTEAKEADREHYSLQIQQSYATAEKKIEAVQKDAAAAEARLQSKITQLESDLAVKQGEAEKNRQTITALEHSNGLLIQQNLDSAELLSERENRLASLTKQLESKECQLTEILEKQRKEFRDIAASHKDALNDYAQRLEDKQAELYECRRELDQLKH